MTAFYHHLHTDTKAYRHLSSHKLKRISLQLTALCSYDMLGINRIATIGCLYRIIGKTVKSRCSPRYRMADCLRHNATEAKALGRRFKRNDAEPVNLPDVFLSRFLRREGCRRPYLADSRLKHQRFRRFCLQRTRKQCFRGRAYTDYNSCLRRE